jgi:hypothetical protein
VHVLSVPLSVVFVCRLKHFRATSSAHCQPPGALSSKHQYRSIEALSMLNTDNGLGNV